MEEFIDSVEYEYPAFYLSMECYWCSMGSEDFILKEHQAAKWLSKETLNSVDWLPADIGLIDTLMKSGTQSLTNAKKDDILPTYFPVRE